MSFQKTALKKQKNVTPDNPRIIHPEAAERTSVPSVRKRNRASAKASASLTIEAAVCLPVFIFFIACMIHFLILIFLQAAIQANIDEAARKVSKQIYASSESEIAALILGGSGVVRAAILDDDLTERLENSRVSGGSGGLHTLLSGYDESTGILDVVASYTYCFPYLPSSAGNLSFKQTCRCRAWIGEELSSDSYSASSGEGDSEDTEEIVYITPTGSAYHKSASCNYLDLSIHSVQAAEIESARNLSGGKYGKCGCAISGSDSYYVTDYGTLYHSDLTCSKLKRTVTAVKISEAEAQGRHACSKCCGSGED